MLAGRAIRGCLLAIGMALGLEFETQPCRLLAASGWKWPGLLLLLGFGEAAQFCHGRCLGSDGFESEMADLLAVATHPRRRAVVAKSDLAGFEFGEEENVTNDEQDGGGEMMETLSWLDLQLSSRWRLDERTGSVDRRSPEVGLTGSHLGKIEHRN
ncbi:hypothetical protein ACLOJK_021924 [Asimina triloba]